MELAEIVMNPARQRIFQYFLLHETGTDKEIRKNSGLIIEYCG